MPYWLRKDGGRWREVTPEEFAMAEEDAGFHPIGGRPETFSFSYSGPEGELEGVITFGEEKPAA